MGIWGVDLDKNDLALDVRETYVNKLRMGLSDEEAVKQLIYENQDYINDFDDRLYFWCSLANVQWDYGRTTDFVIDKAISCIDDVLSNDNNPILISLLNLKKKLSTPCPKRKRVNKIKIYDLKFKVGDLLLYKLTDKQYALFEVIGITKLDYQEYCVLSLYNWVGFTVPTSQDLQELHFVNQRNNPEKKFSFALSLNEKDYKSVGLECIGHKETELSQEYIDCVKLPFLNSENLNIVTKSYLLN